MKEVHVISIIGLIYAVLLSLVTFIFFREYTLWAVLGSAVALFNHSLMIQATMKNKFSTQRYVFHLMQRYVFYLVIIAYTYFETKRYTRQSHDLFLHISTLRYILIKVWHFYLSYTFD